MAIFILLLLSVNCIVFDFGADYNAGTFKHSGTFGGTLPASQRTVEVSSNGDEDSKILIFSNNEYSINVVGSNFDLTEDAPKTFADFYEFRYKVYIFEPHSYVYDLSCLLIELDVGPETCCTRIRLKKDNQSSPVLPYILQVSVFCPQLEQAVYADIPINYEFSGWQTLVFGTNGI